jgi:hypothetical protein
MQSRRFWRNSFRKESKRVAKRKGVLEMVEECGKIVPELIFVHDVNS